MSNKQGLRYYNDYNQIEECPYYPVPSQNRQIIEDYPSDRGHKRDKKWSFSNLFRRKKKDSYSASSSEEEQKKSGGFLQRKRKPESRKKTTKHIGTFDHVVLPPTQRIVSPKPVIYPDHVINDSSQKNSADSYESLHSGKRCHSRSSCASTSLDSFGRKSRRELAKARVEARRDCLKTESSSEEDSQRSASSSITKFRSDDSLVARSRDNSKSRTARTERYIHRRSSKESLNSGNCNSCNGLPLPVKEPSHYYYSPPPLVNYVKPEPPPPPPRDPQRRLIIGEVGENGRPVSYSFETDQQENVPSRMKNCGSTTSVQSYNSDFGNQKQNQRESTPFRSSSVNSEPIRRYIKRHPRLLSETNANGSDKYNYFADHLPRSRKPIIIQSSNLPENKYLSDSQIVTKNSQLHQRNGTKFGRPTIFTDLTSKDSMSTKTPPPIDTFRVRVTKEEGGLVSTVAVKNRISPPKPRILAPSAARAPKLTYSKSEEKEPAPVLLTSERRSSSNLEDALNELEAIYNSLRLGDEDLLDRAEQQEIQARLQSKTADAVQKCGSMSDSGFDFDYQDRNRFKRSFLKSSPGLKKSDDMAERKLQHQQIPAVAELEKGLTQISYLLASPVHNSIDSFCANPQPDEPDITLDDVVFRNIKHINNSLKVIDPQPPFGIPLGPISAAPNSDYLHAVPEEKYRNTFKPNRIPDVVKDDLAYRTLRKDGSKDPSLTADGNCDYVSHEKETNKPSNDSLSEYFQAEKHRHKSIRIPDVFKDDMAYRSLRKNGSKDTPFPTLTAMTADDYINNNKNLPFCAKKKRAVRSLSANIYNLLHNPEAIGKSKSITDINQEEEAEKVWNADEGKSELCKKVQVYVPLYSNDVVVNSKPPSGLLKSSSKRATPSPVPRQTDASEANSSPETVQKHEEALQKNEGKTQRQEETIRVVAEHAKLCERLVECLVESTELISQHKAVTEFVPDDEQLLEMEEEAPIPATLPKATVTESAENQMTTFLEVEPITVEMLSESDDHDYENLDSKSPSGDDIDGGDEVEVADSSESSTMTPVEQIFTAPSAEDEVQDKGERFSSACISSPATSSANAEFNSKFSEKSLNGDKFKSRDVSSLDVSTLDVSRTSSSSNDAPNRQSCAWHGDPTPFISVCYQTACDLFENIDIVALLGLLLAIVSVIVCFVK